MRLRYIWKVLLAIFRDDVFTGIYSNTITTIAIFTHGGVEEVLFEVHQILVRNILKDSVIALCQSTLSWGRKKIIKETNL